MAKANLTAEEKKLLEDISKRLKYVLEERQMSVYRLIQLCPAAKNSIYNAVKATRGIQINTLLKICDTLDMSIADFFSYQVSDDINLSREERIDILNKRKLDAAMQQRVSAYIQGLVDAEVNKDPK